MFPHFVAIGRTGFFTRDGPAPRVRRFRDPAGARTTRQALE